MEEEKEEGGLSEVVNGEEFVVFIFVLYEDGLVILDYGFCRLFWNWFLGLVKL